MLSLRLYHGIITSYRLILDSIISYLSPSLLYSNAELIPRYLLSLPMINLMKAVSQTHRRLVLLG